MTLRNATNGTITIATESFGDPSDVPLVLISGATTSMLFWQTEFCSALADRGRFVVRFDNRDTGLSTQAADLVGDYSLMDMVGDLAAVLDAYGMDEAHLVGRSMGGMIAQLFALEHPERTKSLCAIMSAPSAAVGAEVSDAASPTTSQVPQGLLPGAEDHIVTVVGAQASLDWTDAESVLQSRVEMFRTMAGSAYAFDEAGMVALVREEIARAENISRSRAHLAAMAKSESWQHKLGTMRLPVLIIHGTDDPVLPLGNGRALADLIPDARMVELEGVGHELPREVWEKVIDELLRHTKPSNR